jgi:hypothetical protein
MREGTIKYQFALKKGMEHFPRKRKKLLFDSILRANYELDASSLDITSFALSAPSSKSVKEKHSWEITQCFYFQLFFFYLSLGSYYYCIDLSLSFLFRFCAKRSL